MEIKYKIILAVALCAGSYAMGRYASPEKIKTEIKTVEVIKTVKDTTSDTKKNTHKVTTVTETVNKDGTKTVVTTTTEDSNSDKNSASTSTTDTNKTSDEKKEVTYASSKTHIQILGGMNAFSSTPQVPVYGASVSRDVLGPFSIGVWGLTSGVVGASIGLSF